MHYVNCCANCHQNENYIFCCVIYQVVNNQSKICMNFWLCHIGISLNQYIKRASKVAYSELPFTFRNEAKIAWLEWLWPVDGWWEVWQHPLPESVPVPTRVCSWCQPFWGRGRSIYTSGTPCWVSDLLTQVT